MPPSSLYLTQKSLRIKQHDDFFTRCSSREVSTINLSSEDYHEGAIVTIPFNWESEPGTPKVKSREIPRLPPLTPPPSYFYSTPKRTVKEHSKPKLLDTIFPKRLMGKTRVQLSPASSSSSSSSSSASSSRSSLPWPRSYSVPSSPIRASNLNAGIMSYQEQNNCMIQGLTRKNMNTNTLFQLHVLDVEQVLRLETFAQQCSRYCLEIYKPWGYLYCYEAFGSRVWLKLNSVTSNVTEELYNRVK